MKKNNNSVVSVPVMTLKALKGLLFNAEGDTNLSPIISDLSVGLTDEERDLLSINVALTYKGLVPKIKMESGYSYDWNNRYFRYDFVGYSLIHQTVCYHKTRITVNQDGDDEETNIGNVFFPFGEENFDSFQNIVGRINNYWDEKKKSQQ